MSFKVSGTRGGKYQKEQKRTWGLTRLDKGRIKTSTSMLEKNLETLTFNEYSLMGWSASHKAVTFQCYMTYSTSSVNIPWTKLIFSIFFLQVQQFFVAFFCSSLFSYCAQCALGKKRMTINGQRKTSWCMYFTNLHQTETFLFFIFVNPGTGSLPYHGTICYSIQQGTLPT